MIEMITRVLRVHRVHRVHKVRRVRVRQVRARRGALKDLCRALDKATVPLVDAGVVVAAAAGVARDQVVRCRVE